MTAADELRQAAAKVRETAAKATPGPWSVRTYQRRKHPEVLAHVEFVTPAYVASVTTKRSWGLPDARWKALMSPALAEPLAAWLEHEADRYSDEVAIDTPDCPACDSTLGCGGHDEVEYHQECDRLINDADDGCACFQHVLAVARAINGGAS